MIKKVKKFVVKKVSEMRTPTKVWLVLVFGFLCFVLGAIAI